MGFKFEVPGAQLGNTVLLKREDLQPVFSFKLRGAYNNMVHLTPEVRERGIICSSAGNHAQGVALAAQKLARSSPSPSLYRRTGYSESGKKLYLSLS